MLSAGVSLTLAVSHAAHGQAELKLGVTPELRADVIRLNDRFGAEAGGGVQIPMGYYTRVGVTAAAGAVGSNASGRLDLVARFLFDPFRQQRWGVSAGAGISVRARANDHVRPYLLTVIDLEGPSNASGLTPALQVGLGGGIRLGGALRWGTVRNR
jgi:hypothetical protein